MWSDIVEAFSTAMAVNVSLSRRMVKVAVVVKPWCCCLFFVCVCFVPGPYLKDPPQSGGKFWFWEKFLLRKVRELSFFALRKVLTSWVLKRANIKQGVCHTMVLPFTLKSILQKKEELWKFKYFIFGKKNPPKETKILQDIIMLQLISSFNTSQNITFQKSSYKNRPTTFRAKIP